MHEIVSKDVSKYIEKNEGLRIFFDRLKNAEKKLFLILEENWDKYKFEMSREYYNVQDIEEK